MNKILLLLALLSAILPARAQSPGIPVTPAAECQFHVLADDSFELYVNGSLVWKADDYQTVLQKSLPVSRGDVLVFSVTDKQGGLGGSFAAILLRNNVLVASSKDFRYTVNPPDGFTTTRSLQNLRAPDLVPLTHSFGLGPDKQPKSAWTQKSDRKFGLVHFKFIMP